VRVFVTGVTGQVGTEIVRELQRRAPREVVLAGRDPDGLARAAEQLTQAGCREVQTLELDALDSDRHGAVVGEAFDRLGGVDIVVLAVGVLGARGGLPEDIAGALDVLRVNTVGAGSLLIHSARRLREQGTGTVVVLSSVAGERVRRANVVYGASKAGLDGLALGLADALHDDGVGVMVVRPGFVHTRMTAGLKPAPLSTTPQVVAEAVVGGLDRGARIVWAPSAVRWMMLVMRMLPAPVFRRVSQ